MKLLIRKENYVLRKTPLVWLSVIFLCLAGIFSADSYVYDLTYRRDAIGIFDSMVYDSVVWIILFSAVFSVLLGREFTYKTIDHEIFAGHARDAVYWSKFLVYDVAFCILLLSYPAVGLLRMLGALGVSMGSGAAAAKVLAGLLSICVQYSAIFSLVILIVVICGDIIRSTAVNGLIALACGLVAAYGKPAGWYERVSLLKLLPVQQIRDIVVPRNPGRDMTNLLCGLGMIAVCNGLAVMIFRRKSLK